MRGDAEYFFFPPGTALVTSAFYSVFGFTSTVSHVVATLFWIGFACSSAWFAWLVLDDKKAAWIASVFGSFLPHSLLATTTLSSQPFAATLVTLACCFGIYALQRRSLLYWSLLSIALSLAAITRPAVLLLSVFAAAILLFGWHRSYVTLRSCLVALVVLVVAHLAIIIPVVQHNVEQSVHSRLQNWTLWSTNV
jgi:4-amino-4-deoxy-L-arabinose transferase-like glycosyltransferase